MIAYKGTSSRRFMRSQGSLALHVLLYLHKSVRTDFSSACLHSISSTGSSYLLTVLLETVLEVPGAAAERQRLSALALSLKTLKGRTRIA